MAVELAEIEAAIKGVGTVTPDAAVGQPAANRARQAAAPGSAHPTFRDAGNKKAAATAARHASLGLFKQGGEGGSAEPPTLEQSVRVELNKLRAVEAGTLTDELNCVGVLKWWKT